MFEIFAAITETVLEPQFVSIDFEVRHGWAHGAI